jgi:ribulose-5-phosphate 4-epimerase/fuculose-1-phosphate aldolase
MDDGLLERHFVALSRFAGGRFDLVQAAGGNASVKLSDGRMLVKASGFLLSEVELDKGYVAVRTDEIRAITREPGRWQSSDRAARDGAVAALVAKATMASSVRASIEVFLHAALDRFVLHTHPIAVNVLSATPRWKEFLLGVHPDALCVPYSTPGIDLAVALTEHLDSYRDAHARDPAVIFLQNHGLIVAADSAIEVRSLTEEIVSRCQATAAVDLSRYAAATQVAEFIGGDAVAWLCEDRVLLDLLRSNCALFAEPPFLPDSYVFCGVVPLIADGLANPAPLRAYMEAHRDRPKVVVHGARVFFLGASIRKAREVEEVFKSHLLARAAMLEAPRLLPIDELAYLGAWEAEKYRQAR